MFGARGTERPMQSVRVAHEVRASCACRTDAGHAGRAGLFAKIFVPRYPRPLSVKVSNAPISGNCLARSPRPAHPCLISPPESPIGELL